MIAPTAQGGKNGAAFGCASSRGRGILARREDVKLAHGHPSMVEAHK